MGYKSSAGFGNDYTAQSPGDCYSKIKKSLFPKSLTHTATWGSFLAKGFFVKTCIAGYSEEPALSPFASKGRTGPE